MNDNVEDPIVALHNKMCKAVVTATRALTDISDMTRGMETRIALDNIRAKVSETLNEMEESLK